MKLLKPQIDAALAAKTHLWGKWLPSQEWESCYICNIVRRADDKNKPCKGPVRLSLRG